MASDNENSSEYAKVMGLQNFGIPCPYCHSSLGHYGICSLINGHPKEYVNSPHEVATVPDTETPAEKAYQYVVNHEIQESRFYQELESESPARLHALGIRLY
jgi:hypothetical protein